jgi:L-lactate utilization protein LutC
MKAKTFENLIRKIVREEIDYALRREIKSLKEDIRDDLKSTLTENTTNSINEVNKPLPEAIKTSLKEKIMGTKPIKKQNFVKDKTLNSLLNETAQGDTNTQTAMAPINDPFSNGNMVPTEALPTEIANVVNRDYRSLMKAIDNKKGK